MTRREWLALTAAAPLLNAKGLTGFQCEDLAQNGLVLIPPSSPEFDTLVAGIEQRAPERNLPKISEADREVSAILVNRGQKPVAGLQAVWRFETADGHSFRHSWGMLQSRGVLLPFGFSEVARKRDAYWHTILPGSKRYLTDGRMMGDNTDVRPPDADERIGSGGGGGGGGAHGTLRDGIVITQGTLAIDGAFFADGEFAGPNREQLWEKIVAEAEARMSVGQVAREGRDKGESAQGILDVIAEMTGPAPERIPMPPMIKENSASMEDYRHWALQQVAFEFFGMPMRDITPEHKVETIAAWSDTVLPKFRRA